MHCTGEDSARSLFHRHGFVCNYFASDKTTVYGGTTEPLFGLLLAEDSIASEEMLSVLFQKARVNIQLLDVAARENAKLYDGQQSFGQLRHNVTGLLFTLWRLLKLDRLETDPVEAGLHQLDMLLGSIESMPIIKIVHTSCRIDGNKVCGLVDKT